MDPLSLVPQHIRLLAKKRPPRQDDKSDNLSSALTQSWQLPYSQHEEFALVAIIDISGYSKLSSYLQEVLGSDSGAKVKELLNKPINAIIKHVHMSGGSVVKFAGDAVIAMWSVPSTSQEIRETTVRRVFTSCLQLMIFFKNYELVVPLKQAGQTGTTSSASSTRTDGRRNSVDATNDRRRSSSVITEALEKQTKKQPLKIHIGLGIGEMQHVHIGDDVSKTGSADGLFPRSEYFIAGKSLKNSGILLGLGKPGDFTFDSIGHDFVIGAMTAEPSFPPVRKGSRELGGRYFMVTETDPIDKYLLCLNQALQAQPDLNSDSEGTLISSKERDSGFINTIVPYIDDALAQSVRVVEPVSSSEELDGESPFSVDLGNYDQLRGVAVLFLYFPAFNVDTVAQPDNLSKLQKITVVILAAIRKHQGCLRQFNCDDKSLTALLVWGLEGFAHEKSECYFSMAAAMDMIPQLGEIIGNYFAIGATKGTVFAGIIGNQNRCDGTLLGVCVNNAARLMCLDRCMGGILCDEDTYKDTSDTIEYDTDIPEVILKGVPNPVKVYSPLQRNQAQKVAKAKVIIEGRENEIKEISEVITSWITESKRRLLIAGRSGTGKSILLQHIEEKVKEIPRSILCVGKCQENHQNTLLSAYTHVVNELASNIRSQHVKTRDLFVLMQQEANASRSSLCADTISGRTSIQSRGNKSKSMTKVETVEVFGKVSATDIANLPGLVRQASNKKAPPETTEESKKLKGGEHRKSSPNTLVQTEALLPEPFELSKLKRSPSLTRQDSVTSTNDQLKVPKRQLTKGGSSRSIGKEDIKKVGHRQAISIEPKSNNAKLDNLLTAATSLSNISAACGVEIFSPATNTTSIKASVDNIQDLTLAELMATLFTGPECDTLNAIPALNLSSNNQVVTQEILPRIALLFAKLFEALASVGHRVCIIFDDLQWCDAYSLELTLCLMQKCNNVLFVGLKRPIEEWKESRIPMLLKIKSNTTNYIGLSNLDRLAIEAIIKQLSILNPTSVSKELTDEIFNRSQGNPLVAQVLIRILNDDVNVALADGVLVRRGDKNSATLPSGATAAVVAQFDKLKGPMKLILKYASISGMSFNVQELNEIILKSNETLPYDKTHLGIIQIIETSDVYQFVKKTDMKDVYCFSHFLIQQGILSTMVPSKREEIHSVYADYFLKKMNKSANKWENIQAVVYHLFQVTGQEERKQITLYTAFLESAEMGMISEAFEFYEALQDFENKLELARNVYEAIREHRLLAYIHLGKGHMVESMEHCRAGLALAGQPITSNNIIAATRFAKMFRAASQILASKDEAKQISVSASFVKSTFSKAFQPNNPTTNAIRASIASRRGSRRTSRINSNSHDLNWKVIDEIVQTLRLRQKMTPPSFELIEMQGVCLILGVKLMKERELAVASYFAEFSTSLNLLGFDKLSQIASARCQQLVDDFKETNGPDYVPTDEEDKSIAAIFKSQGQHHWKNGKWNEAAALIKSAEELLSNRGRGFSDDCYLARNDAANLYLIGGNFFRCKALVEDDMKFHLTDEYEELNAEFYFRQAALAAEEGVFESAERWYNQALELYSVSQDDSLRTLACMSNALRAAIMILHGVDGDEGSTKYLLGRISMHLETCLEKTEEIEPLQVPLAARIWITILLLLIELHTNLGQNTVLKSNLATSIRAITVQIQKTNKPNLLKPLTPLNALCRCIAHGIGFLWLEKSNIVGFESSIRKGISQVEGGSSLMDKQLKRAILVRLWRVQAVSGNANCKTESWIAEGKGHMKSFETDGFIYEGELLRAALNHVNPNFI